MSARPLVLSALAAAFAISLAACTPFNTEGARRVLPASPSAAAPSAAAPSASAQPAPDGDCGGLPVTLSAGRDLRLQGDCPQVTITGTEVEVDLTGATVDEIVVEGDRHDVDAGGISTLRVSGQDNDIEATTIASLEIMGDRNELDVGGEAGTVVVDGNDNEVDAGALGSVDDRGERNVIVVDR